jgi:hypothetical protein
MVRVNGQQSAAVATNVATEVKGALGQLFLEFEAPPSDSHLWKRGARVTMKRHGVIGPFIVDELNCGDCLEVSLQSAGALRPLESPP